MNEENGLEYKSAIFGKPLHKTFKLSGLLSPNRKCLGYNPYEYEKIGEKECKL